VKCSKCGKRVNSLPAMAKHYRKKHPGAMKRKHHEFVRVKSLKSAPGVQLASRAGRFCPHCGGFLG